MASIDFCPLAKPGGGNAHGELIAGEGDHPPCTGASAKEGWGDRRDHQAQRGLPRGDGPALGQGGGGRPLLSRTGKPGGRAATSLSEDRHPHGTKPLAGSVEAKRR